MAKSSDSLLQFDSISLDANDNLSHTENRISDVIEQRKSIPSNVESETLQNHINISELSNSSLILCNSFEMPEATSDLPNAKLDILIKNSIDNSNNSSSDSGIHDSDNNIVENRKLIDFTGADLGVTSECGAVIADFSNEENCVQAKDEEFHDAVQFFKDQTSMTFLERAGSSNIRSEPSFSRSSLYMNFDPLSSKFCPQLINKANELHEIAEIDVDPELHFEEIENGSDPVLVNKHLVNASPRQSLGNILISFDSPQTDSQSVKNTEPCEPPRHYTENELQQALKIQELSVQETFLKRQHDLEIERSEKQKETEIKLYQQNHLCSSLHEVLKEVLDVTYEFADKQKKLELSLGNVEEENAKLKTELKTSVEDLQSVESTFADFHKRYEQCKSMLKTYTQNEDNLKQQLENMHVKLQEKDEMYKTLQSRTQEILDKANTEVTNAKKASDAQVAVLKAQLKKAELKISSLESDVKHTKIENSKLSSICDDLMAKVSET